MKPHRALLVLLALASLAGGCASFPGGEQRIQDPKALLAQAERARDAGNPDLAYRYLALIQVFHPDSPESAQAFPEAARLFKYLYDREVKLANYDSIWVSSEPYFVFRWLEDFAGDEFPQQQMDLLFLRSRYSLFERFLRYATDRAAFHRWNIRAQDDNGIIESVVATPRSA